VAVSGAFQGHYASPTEPEERPAFARLPLRGAGACGQVHLSPEPCQAVNCASADPPCQECTSCRRIAASKHSDIHIVDLISVEKKEIGIRQIADMQNAAHLPPFEGKNKVFIFDRAEMLSHEAANSLLKTLEEPPPNILIILLTARESALLPTIASRCQRVELRPLPLGLVIDVLTKDYHLPQEKADLLARLSGGSLAGRSRPFGTRPYFPIESRGSRISLACAPPVHVTAWPMPPTSLLSSARAETEQATSSPHGYNGGAICCSSSATTASGSSTSTRKHRSPRKQRDSHAKPSPPSCMTLEPPESNSR